MDWLFSPRGDVYPQNAYIIIKNGDWPNYGANANSNGSVRL